MAVLDYSRRCTPANEIMDFVARDHGLINGARVSLHGSRGGADDPCETWMACLFEEDPDIFTLNTDLQVGVTAVDTSEPGQPKVTTAVPHCQPLRSEEFFEDDTVVTLRGFRHLHGQSFRAVSVSPCELVLCDYELDAADPAAGRQGRAAAFEELVRREGLRPDDAVVMPDGFEQSARLAGGGVLRLAPRSPPRAETEQAWQQTLALRFPDGRPAPVSPAPAAEALTVGCCGMTACTGCYSRLSQGAAGVQSRAFARGCTRLAFEPCLGLWAITAELRPDPHDAIYEARLVWGERELRWEGPQLLYVCLDPDPTGRWVAVHGKEPAPTRVSAGDPSARRLPQCTATMQFEACARTLSVGPGVLAAVFGCLLDFGAARWQPYYDLDVDCGDEDPVPGNSSAGPDAAEIAQRIRRVVQDAEQMASVARAWRTDISEWMLTWLARPYIFYGDRVQGGSVLPCPETLQLLSRTGSRPRSSFAQSTVADPAFSRHVWGAVLTGIDLVRSEPPEFVPKGLFSRIVVRGFSAFLAELFAGTESPLGCSPWELVQPVKQCPRVLRGRPHLLIDGASAMLLSDDARTSLLVSRWPAAYERLSAVMRRDLSALGDVGRIELTGVSTAWQACGGDGDPRCSLHPDVCVSCSCYRRKRWRALEALTELRFELQLAGFSHSVRLETHAFVVPFLAVYDEAQPAEGEEAEARIHAFP